MNPTPEQRAAIESGDRSLLVEAGAGTGKTMVLVARFLHLLAQPGAQMEGIVAITFTEKAARTMRERLRRAVEAKAAASGPASPWQAHRRALAQMQVSTIHSLCARLLRENAIEAALDPLFGVLDEQQMMLLRGEAIEQSLRTLVEEQGKALQLLDQLTVRTLRAEMARLLEARGTVGPLFEALPDDHEALLARWAEQRQAAQREAAAALRAAGPLAEAMALIGQVTVSDPGDKLAPAVAIAQEAVAAVARGELDALEGALAINLQGGTQKAWGGKEALSELKAALKALREQARALEGEGLIGGEAALDEAAATALLHWRALWERLTATYDGLKAARYALDFDDLERRTAELLAQRPRPARLAATVAAIRYLLVDEFQDTNLVQQAIVCELAPIEQGRLFVVGDAKQSIYRFRQAQVSVFNRTGQDIAARTGRSALPLSHSFRSHESLVAAINDLFARLLAPSAGGPAPYEAAPGPLVATRRLPDGHPAAPVPLELTLLVPPAEEKMALGELRLHEARLVAERLSALEASRFPVYDSQLGGYRPFQFGDAALLFAATRAMPPYEEALRAAGIPYLTNAGRGYFDRPEVRDLQALLEATANPRDDLALATVLRSPLGLLSDETLLRLRWFQADGAPCAHDAPRPLREALLAPPPTDQPARVAEAATLMARLWALAGRVEVGELLQEALALTGYEALLAQDDRARGQRQLNNVQKFAEMARERGGASLPEFLELLRVLQQKEVREGEAVAAAPEGGAVQLMTIHAAKGLEFPVVALVDLSRRQERREGGELLGEPGYGLACRLRDRDNSVQAGPRARWLEAVQGRMAEAERRRLLYVACTRAADLLLLFGSRSHSEGASWLSLIRAAWGVEFDGPAEERLPQEGFTLLVRRPPLPSGAPARRAAPPVAPPGPYALPALAHSAPPEAAAPLEPLEFTVW